MVRSQSDGPSRTSPQRRSLPRPRGHRRLATLGIVSQELKAVDASAGDRWGFFNRLWTR
jgi:hypothetical protein